MEVIGYLADISFFFSRKRIFEGPKSTRRLGITTPDERRNTTNTNNGHLAQIIASSLNLLSDLTLNCNSNFKLDAKSSKKQFADTSFMVH